MFSCNGNSTVYSHLLKYIIYYAIFHLHFITFLQYNVFIITFLIQSIGLEILKVAEQLTSIQTENCALENKTRGEDRARQLLKEKETNSPEIKSGLE